MERKGRIQRNVVSACMFQTCLLVSAIRRININNYSRRTEIGHQLHGANTARGRPDPAEIPSSFCLSESMDEGKGDLLYLQLEGIPGRL